MYPQKCNWLVCYKMDEDQYWVIDKLLDRAVELTTLQMYFLSKLDGKTDPYTIDESLSKEEVDSILHDLEFEFLLREDKHKLIWEDGMYMWTIHIPKRRKKRKKVAKICNALLLYSVLPIFLLGIFLRFHPIGSTVPDTAPGSFWLCIGIIILSAMIHEIAHGNACLAYGGNVFEYGVMISGLMPCFYTLMDYKGVKNGYKRLQIIAAGVESHLLLAGIGMIVARLFPELYMPAMHVFFVNIVLAIVNFSFIDTTDGMCIIGLLCFGDERIVDKAKRIARSKRYRKRLYKEGVNGYMKVGVSYMLCAVQILYPLLLVYEIMVVFGW